MDVYEVVTKLIGPVEPVGESRTDAGRYENLGVLCDLIESLSHDLIQVSANRERHEHSMKKAGEMAYDRIVNIIVELGGTC